MAYIADRVKQTTTSTGTGSVLLNGSCTGFQDFSAAFSTGATVYYCIEDGTNWEVGIGTYTSGSPGTVSRDTVLSSSAGGSKISLSAGTKDVFVTAPAARLAMLAPDGSPLTLPSQAGNAGKVLRTDGATASWSTLPASNGVVAVTANYSVTAADAGKLLACNGTFTLSLTAASTLGNGFCFSYRNISGGTITIDPAETATINGRTVVYVRAGESGVVYCDGTNFWTVTTGSGENFYWSTTDFVNGDYLTISNNNRTSAFRTTLYYRGGHRGASALTGTRIYFEMAINDLASSDNVRLFGVASPAAPLSSNWDTAEVWGYQGNGNRTGASQTAYGGALSAGRVLGIAINYATGRLWAAINNVWQGSGNPVTGVNPMYSNVPAAVFPIHSVDSLGSTVTLNIKGSELAYDPPSGFSPLLS